MDSQPPGIRLIALERKLNALQLQVDGLHQQLAEARVSMMELVSSLRPAAEEAAADEPAGMARAVPTAPPTVPVRPIHIEPPPSAVRPADEIAPTPPVEVPPTPRRPLPFKEERHVNWEAVIGANWLNRIGVLVLLLAGAFLAHLAWQRHWINPTAQTVFVFAVGVALLVAGEVFQRRNVLIFAQGLTSLGIFALYAGGFMGYHLHGLLSLNATFIAYTVITAIAFLLAARTNSIAVVLMGMLGGYLTPVILSTGQDAPIALFTYLLFLNAAIAATAIAKRWDFLQLIAFAATFIMFAGWFIKFYEPPKRWTIEWMLSLHAGLFMLASVVPRVVLGRAASGISCWVLAKASLAFFGVTCLLFKWVPENRLGEFAFAYAAGHWLVAAGVHALRRRRDPLIANLLGLGAIYVTLAIPLYYSADSLAIAWSVQALVFTCIGIWYARWRTLASAAIVFALAVFYTLSHDWWDTEWRGEWGWFDVRFATMAIVAATLGLAGLAYRIGRSRLADLAEWGSPRVPFAWVVLGNAVLILAAMHQFLDNHLALAWAANAVVAAGLAWWRRHILAGWFALVALVPAVLRFLAHQCANVKPEVWQWDIDIRFAQGLLVVAGIWLVAFLVRRRLRWEDLPERSTVALLVGDAMLCVVFALQWEHQTLTAMFALNALALSGFARWRNLHGLAWASVLAFALTAVRWLGWDYGRDEVLAAAPPVLVSFAGGAGLVAAGWMAAAILRGRWGGVVATVLGLGMNLVLLAVIDAQWDRYAMLTLWAVDVAVLWAIGFRFESWASRAEAFLLWVFLLGGWIVFSGFAWQGELADFTVLLNSRFGSLLLVALIGFAASWAYRVKLGRPSSPTPQSMTVVQMLRLSPGEFVAAVPNTAVSERNGDWSCAVLANLLLVTALTMEILTRFDRYRFEGDSPFENWEMARQAALSILWTAYAAAAFIGGFVLRYKPVRLLALISLGPILAKVFLVDLRDLEVIYRVLSFAVLGVVFIGISYLYQRYARRIAPDVP